MVNNASGQRLCEKQVGQRYERWKVWRTPPTRNRPAGLGSSSENG
jgi:hypothetical protein